MPENDQKSPDSPPPGNAPVKPALVDLGSHEAMAIVSEFIEIEKHAEKCAFFHAAANFPVLSRIYRAIHFPKP